MASMFLVNGDLFVELVDNSDGGGFSAERAQQLGDANQRGEYDTIAFPFERSNGYNGIRQLYHRQGPKENIFATAWSSSLNFEFVYDASGRYMTPRWEDGRMGSAPTPSRLTRIDRNSACLEVFVPPPHRVDVKTQFSLVPPYYIDIETEILPRAGAFIGDWLGLFWANYIHTPEHKATFFKGRAGKADPVRFVSSLAELPASLAPQARAFVKEDGALLPAEPDIQGGLMHNIRPTRFVDPYFFGRWRNMMFLMMFRTDLDLRLAIQPTGGGLNGTKI